MKKPPAKPRCAMPEDFGVSRCWIGAILSIAIGQVVCRPAQLRAYIEYLTKEDCNDVLEKFEDGAFLGKLQKKTQHDFTALCFWAASEARCESCRCQAKAQFDFVAD